MKRRTKQMMGLSVIVLLVAFFMIYIRFFNGSLIYISMGLKDNELFSVSNTKAYTWESSILLSDTKQEYEAVFGSSVWNESMDGVGMDEYVKDQVKTKLVRVKCMNLLAKKKGVVLSRTQKEAVRNAADTYYNGLTSDVIEQLGIDHDKIEQMYTEFAIADILYNDISANTQGEISSDDARVIAIQYICCDNHEDIKAAKARLDAGESFYTVSKDYGGEQESETELKRGVMDAAFEKAAFDLKTGQTSDIVKAGEHYYIIKCTSDNEKSKTEANKLNLIGEAKLAHFNEVFEEFEQNQYVEMNDKVWSNIHTRDISNISVNFEDIFKEYIKE